jgi:hypothetical protein
MSHLQPQPKYLPISPSLVHINLNPLPIPPSIPISQKEIHIH